MPRQLLIVNPHAAGGRAAERVAALRERLGPEFAGATVMLTEAPGHAEALARQHAGEYDLLVAVGGDGTVGEVAGGLLAAGHDCLAILPLGTGNDIAWNAGLHGWDDGVAALAGSAERRLDVLSAEFATPDGPRTRAVLVGAGAGSPAEVLGWATERVKRRLGRWSYLYAALATALTFRSPLFRITADGQVSEGRFLLVAVANGAETAGHSMRMAPGAQVDDGLADVILARDGGLWRRLVTLARLARGAHEGTAGATHGQAVEVRVDADPPARLNLDGDLLGTTPLTIRLLPGALRLRVPAQPTRS